jgi:hypothetical protein
MKKVITLILLWLLPPLSVYAAQIYGRLKEGGRAVVGVDIEITCKGKNYSGKTDNNGAYSIYVQEKGKCDLKVHKGQGPNYTVYSYDNPVRYDFELVEQNGKYTLRRK